MGRVWWRTESRRTDQSGRVLDSKRRHSASKSRSCFPAGNRCCCSAHGHFSGTSMLPHVAESRRSRRPVSVAAQSASSGEVRTCAHAMVIIKGMENDMQDPGLKSLAIATGTPASINARQGEHSHGSERSNTEEITPASRMAAIPASSSMRSRRSADAAPTWQPVSLLQTASVLQHDPSAPCPRPSPPPGSSARNPGRNTLARKTRHTKLRQFPLANVGDQFPTTNSAYALLCP